MKFLSEQPNNNTYSDATCWNFSLAPCSASESRVCSGNEMTRKYMILTLISYCWIVFARMEPRSYKNRYFESAFPSKRISFSRLNYIYTHLLYLVLPKEILFFPDGEINCIRFIISHRLVCFWFLLPWKTLPGPSSNNHRYEVDYSKEGTLFTQSFERTYESTR